MKAKPKSCVKREFVFLAQLNFGINKIQFCPSQSRKAAHTSLFIFSAETHEKRWLLYLFQPETCHSCTKFSCKRWIATDGTTSTSKAITIYQPSSLSTLWMLTLRKTYQPMQGTKRARQSQRSFSLFLLLSSLLVVCGFKKCFCVWCCLHEGPQPQRDESTRWNLFLRIYNNCR